MNSLDMHIELLKAARDMVQTLEPMMAAYNRLDGPEDQWHPATIQYRNLKQAVDHYGDKL